MGLDTSHDCWHGPYSSFMQWREELAKAAGMPPLQQMDGFIDGEGIKWESLAPDVIHVLLNHSDCDGFIERADCKPLADRLKELLPLLPDAYPGWRDYYRDKTTMFIRGLMLAHNKKQRVEFR